MQANKFLKVVLKFWDYALWQVLLKIFLCALYWIWCLWTVCQALCNILGFFTHTINFQLQIFSTLCQPRCNWAVTLSSWLKATIARQVQSATHWRSIEQKLSQVSCYLVEKPSFILFLFLSFTIFTWWNYLGSGQ